MIKINSTEIDKLVVKSGSITEDNPVVKVNGTQVWPVDLPDLIGNTYYYPADSTGSNSIVDYVPVNSYRNFKVKSAGFLFSIGSGPTSFGSVTKNCYLVTPGSTYQLRNQQFRLSSGTGSEKSVFFVGTSWLDTSNPNLWYEILRGDVNAVIYYTGPNSSPAPKTIYSFRLNLDIYFID